MSNAEEFTKEDEKELIRLQNKKDRCEELKKKTVSDCLEPFYCRNDSLEELTDCCIANAKALINVLKHFVV